MASLRTALRIYASQRGFGPLLLQVLVLSCICMHQASTAGRALNAQPSMLKQATTVVMPDTAEYICFRHA